MLSFLLISIDNRHTHLAAIRAMLSVALYPVQYAVTLPVRFVDSVADSFATRNGLAQDNTTLREENLLLRNRVQKFVALEAENRRLRALLDSSVERGEEVVAADILAIETNSVMRQLVINKGSRQHVYVGQPIADAHGILGQIIQVNPLSSTVILITDARHALPVIINRNGIRAVAMGGDTNDELTLSFVPNNADVNVGDLVVTSGLDRRFPSGYPVGTVVRAENDPSEPFAHIVLKPSAHIGRAREVLLVWPRAQPNEATAPATATVQ